MGLSLWRYELRRLGPAALIAPPLVLAILGFLAFLSRSGDTASTGRILSTGLDLLPLVAGVAAASTVVGDDALELQATLPTPYSATIARRLALALGWPALLALATTLALARTGYLTWPVAPAADQLIWLAPSLWLAGAGAALALALRSAAAASGLLTVVWGLEQLLRGFFSLDAWRRLLWLFLRFRPDAAPDWFWNRAALVGGALGFFALAWWLLRRPERLLGEEG